MEVVTRLRLEARCCWFAPPIPDLKHLHLYSFRKPPDHPALAPLISSRIDMALIRWLATFHSGRLAPDGPT